VVTYLARDVNTDLIQHPGINQVESSPSPINTYQILIELNNTMQVLAYQREVIT